MKTALFLPHPHKNHVQRSFDTQSYSKTTVHDVVLRTRSPLGREICVEHLEHSAPAPGGGGVINSTISSTKTLTFLAEDSFKKQEIIDNNMEIEFETSTK